MKAPSFGQQQLYTMVLRQGAWADTGRGMGMAMGMVMGIQKMRKDEQLLFSETFDYNRDHFEKLN